MLLQAILSNKAKLRKSIASIIQPLNTNNKENTAIFMSRIKEEEYLVRKDQAINIKKKRAIKRYKKIRLFKCQYSHYQQYNSKSLIWVQIVKLGLGPIYIYKGREQIKKQRLSYY